MIRQLPAVLFIFFAAVIGCAQSPTAGLTGRITDQTKAIIQDAKILALNTATGVQYQTTTDSTGNYTISGLPPGIYRVEIEKQGFRTVLQNNVTLNVQSVAAINVEMTVGSASESVTVQSGTLTLNTTDAGVGTVIDRDFVGNLPLNGRSFQSLILLTPGVTVTNSTTSDYGQFSADGQRASTNYLTIDGVSANVGIGLDNFGAQNTALGGAYPGLSAFGGTNNLVSIDALQEFKIQTSTTSAEYGRQPGAQISLVTRSGSNQWHGTLFEYLRNDAFDARDYFNQEPQPKPALRQNDFGGTFSGPIFKNRTFFFFSYEGERLRLPLSGINDVPALRVRQEAAGPIRPLLDAFPIPTGPELVDASGLPIGWAPFDYGISNPSSLDSFSLRADQVVNSKLTLFGRVNHAPSSSVSFAGSAAGQQTTISTQTVTLGATATFTPRLSNEFRFNWSRQLAAQSYLQATYGGAVPVDSPALTNGLGGTGIVFFSFAGYSGELQGGDFVHNTQRQFNANDSILLVTGAHQLKFGVDYRRLLPTYAPQSQQDVGFFSEGSVVSSTADYVFLQSYEASHPQFQNLSLFGQDTWKISKRLTLDLGLRWELNPAPTEANDEMPPVVLGITGNPPNYSNASLAPAGSSFYKTFYSAFAPRLGFAYQVKQKAGWETVLRGGFGVYYDLGSNGATSGFPLGATSTNGGVLYPLSGADAARPAITPITSLPITDGQAVYINEQDLRLPYTLQWNLALEQALGSQQQFSMTYAGSAGRRLLVNQDLNQPAGSYVGPRPNPNFADIFYVHNASTSDYNSLQAQYQARLRRGLQALVNYTWSHAIDDVSTSADYFALTRGNADFDVRQNLSTALTYAIPAPRGPRFIRESFRNWSIDSIVHAQSGRPIDIFSDSVVVDGSLQLLRPDVVPGQPLYINDPSAPGGRRFNPAAFQAPPYHTVCDSNGNCASVPVRQGDFGRNVLQELALYQWDFAVGRSFAILDRVKLQFKGELFNILNHPMFGSYGTYWYPGNTTFGVPTQTMNYSLGGLSPLYQLGGPRSVQFSLKLSF